MSAYVVDRAHLDYLIEAGLRLPGTGPLSWQVPEDPRPTDHRRGEPWGPTAIIHAQERHRELTPESADRVGEMLLTQNERSYDHRYDGQDRQIRLGYHYEGRGVYAQMLGRYPDGWRWSRVMVAPVGVLKAISCYEYQACEDPGWERSEARAFCDALRRRAIHALPGYDAAAWDVRAVVDMAPADDGVPVVEARA